MSASQLVCVTGASGYVASHCIKLLLQQGYRVRGTVRSTNDDGKVAFLRNIAQECSASERLELLEADLLSPDSYDSAIVGCDYVLHTASPFFIDATRGDPQERFLRPAVEGTENVLSSVAKAGCVKRVVVTSSIAAVHGYNDDKQGAYNEDDWNTTSTAKASAYSLSKTLAEKKAWELAGAQEQYDLVTINPGLVVGPSLSGRGTASYDYINAILGGAMCPAAPDLPICCVDVRDVAQAHVTAMVSPAAKGRFIVAPSSLTPMAIAAILKPKFPMLPYPKFTAPKFALYLVGPMNGISWSFVKHNIGKPLNFDCSKAQKELALEFRDVKESLVEMVQVGLDTGIIKRR
eukprot:m.92380 g.92380  ORF g.92380 m.92380 type:complete len:348 (+) comp14942_c0_seq3:1226-2269(+)